MRITGGVLQGHHLISPRGLSLRPTRGLVREALFQVLAVQMDIPWQLCHVVDLFAGTGQLGIEALSRGARDVVFVDRSRSSIDLIRRNLEICGLIGHATLIRAEIGSRSRSLRRVLRSGPFELILADPPYSQGLGREVLDLVSEASLLSCGGWMVIEEFKKEPLPSRVIPRHMAGAKLSLQLVESRRYGQTVLWFYRSIDDVIRSRSPHSYISRHI